MGFGFKYHVVTVAAIFFALTVGLVVGSLLVSPRVTETQSATIATLTNEIKTQLKEKDQQLDHLHKCLTVVVPAFIKERLKGVNVAVVQTGDYPEATARAKEALEQAGAQVISVTTIGRNFDRSDTILLPALSTLHQTDLHFPMDRTSLAEAIAGILSRGDSLTDSLLPALEREDYLHAESGSQYTTGARYVVLIAGTRSEVSERTSNVDGPLVLALQKLGIEPVMCEPKDAAFSDVDAYQKLNLVVTTIDDIDFDIGPVSLVFSLGGEKGSYGEKSSAASHLPQDLSRTDGR